MFKHIHLERHYTNRSDHTHHNFTCSIPPWYINVGDCYVQRLRTTREYTKRHLVTDDRSNWRHLAMMSHLLVKWSTYDVTSSHGHGKGQGQIYRSRSNIQIKVKYIGQCYISGQCQIFRSRTYIQVKDKYLGHGHISRSRSRSNISVTYLGQRA